MSTQFSTNQTLRSEMKFAEEVLCEEILKILSNVTLPDITNEKWTWEPYISSRAYKTKFKIEKINYSFNSAFYTKRDVPRKPESRISFELRVKDIDRHYKWNKYIENIYLSYNAKTEEFKLKGKLVNPIKSSNISTVTDHLKNELIKAAERIRSVKIMYTQWVQTEEPPFRKILTRVSGIGEKTEKRLANEFASFSNILYNKEKAKKLLSTAYGNEPDYNSLFKNISEAVVKYKNTDTGVPLEELNDFPKQL